MTAPAREVPTLAERAAAIERVVKGMTKGPWYVPVANVHRVIAEIDGFDGYRLIVEYPEDAAQFGQARVSYQQTGDDGTQSAADRQGIVLLRNDAPALLDDLVRENEALLKDLRELTDAIDLDSQPVSKDSLYIVRPGWYEAVRAVAARVRRFDPDEAKRLALAVTR